MQPQAMGTSIQTVPTVGLSVKTMKHAGVSMKVRPHCSAQPPVPPAYGRELDPSSCAGCLTLLSCSTRRPLHTRPAGFDPPTAVPAIY